MNRVTEMKQLGEEMALDLKKRLELLKEIQEYTRQLLTRYHRDRKEMYQQLQQMLEDDHKQRAEFLNKFLLESHKENAQAYDTWQKTLQELNRIREQACSA
ncbi:MAG: hypothetical protein AB1510_05660 [Bacillota bacterium]